MREGGRRMIFVQKKISEKKITMDQNLILWADESPSDRNKLKQEVPSSYTRFDTKAHGELQLNNKVFMLLDLTRT